MYYLPSYETFISRSYVRQVFLVVTAFTSRPTYVLTSSRPSVLFTSTFMWPCIVTNFFIIKPTRCINFSNLLRHETLHVSGSSSAHHQEFIHCTLGTGTCHTGLKTAFEQVLFENCLQTCMTHTSAECTVNKLLMMGGGAARNMKSFMPE